MIMDRTRRPIPHQNQHGEIGGEGFLGIMRERCGKVETMR